MDAYDALVAAGGLGVLAVVGAALHLFAGQLGLLILGGWLVAGAIALVALDRRHTEEIDRSQRPSETLKQARQQED